jgi:Transposase
VLVSFAAHVLKDVGLRPTAFSDPPTQCGDPSPLVPTITPHVTGGDAPLRLTTREAMAHRHPSSCPSFYVLEAAFTCVLVNPVHMAQVPGRKTDVQDCVWIAQLLEHGLLRGSFVPPAPIRELRDLTRYRKTIVPVGRAGSTPGPGSSNFDYWSERGPVETGCGEFRREVGVPHGHRQGGVPRIDLGCPWHPVSLEVVFGIPIRRSHRKCDARPARNDLCCAYLIPKSRQVSSTSLETAG